MDKINFQQYVVILLNRFDRDEHREVRLALEAIIDLPTGDKRIIAYLENLLEDRRIISSPPPEFWYMEMRYVAAEALAAELDTQGRYEPFQLKNTFRPLKAGDIKRLAKQANISAKDKSYEALLEELLAANLVPLIDL